MSRRRRTQAAGLASVAESIGSAVGLVRRLVPKRRAESMRVATGAAQSAPDEVAAPVELQRRLEKVRGELARLEMRLDEQRELIARGPLTGAMDGEQRTELLDSMVAQTRRLKEEIRDRREELGRVERQIVRSGRLTRSRPTRVDEAEGDAQASIEDPDRTGESIERKRRRANLQAGLRRVMRAGLEQHTNQLKFEDMVQGLFGDSVELQREMAGRLGETRTRLALDLLVMAADDPSDRVRLAVLNGLLGFRATEAIEVHRRFLHDDQVLLRVAALRSLASVKRALSDDQLLEAVEDPHPAMRKAAATVLGWRAVRRGMPALVFALGDEDESVRIAAAASLGTLGDLGAVLSLIRSLGDESSAVQVQVRDSLRTLAGPAIDSVGEDAQGEQRIPTLKRWWREARVGIHVERAARSGDDSAELAARIAARRAAEEAERAASGADHQSVFAQPGDEPAAASPAAEDAQESVGLPVDDDGDAGDFEGIGAPSEDEDGGFEGIGAPSEDDNEDGGFEGIGAPSEDDSEDGGFEGIGVPSDDDGEGGDFEGIGVPSDDESEESEKGEDGEGGEDFESVFGGDDE